MDSRPHYADSSEKNKRVVRNIVSFLMNNLVTIVCGLLVPRLFLLNFGSQVNGLVHTIKQILGYLALLEAGVGLASQQALYQPIEKNDRDGMNAILSATHLYYRRTGLAYFCLSLLFAFVYPFLVDSGLSYSTVVLIILMYALPEVLKYLVQGKYRVFLIVEGKSYVLNNISTVMVFVCNVLRIAALYLTDRLLLIQAIYCLPTLVQVIVVMIYIKRHYAWIDLSAAPNFSALRQKSSVLVHQISALIFNNTDTVLISMLCGLKEASVYTIYMTFFNAVEKLIHSFSDGISFRLGRLYHSNREFFLKLYDLYEEIYLLFVFILYTVVAAFLLPVISLYTRGIEDISYVNSAYVIFFSFSHILLNLKNPATQLVTYSGDFDRTHHHAVIEMLLNLIVSILGAMRFGILGCLAGTIVALTYRGTALMRFSCKNILNISSVRMIRRTLVNTALFAGVIAFLGTHSCAPDGYLHVFLAAGLNAVWIAAAFLAVNLLLELKTFRLLPEVIKRLRRPAVGRTSS